MRSTPEGFSRNAASSRELNKGWAPAAGSLAANEVDGQAAVAGDWADRPVTEAYNTAALLLSAADDHLLALVRLYQAPPPVFGSLSVARSLFEACGRAWWLLDPTIDARQRVARWATERLHSLTETGKLPARARQGLDYEHRIDLIVSSAKDHGYVVKHTRLGPWVGETRPSNTSLIEQMLATEGDTDLGSVLYRTLAGGSHSVLDALVRRMELIENPDDSESMLGRPMLDPSMAAQVVIGASFAYEAAWERLLATHGWDRRMWAQWKLHANKRFKDVLNAVHSTE